MFVQSSQQIQREGESIRPGAGGEGRPLTVLQLVPNLNTGGVERGTLEMTDAIVGAGGRALIATSGGTQAVRVPRLGGELIPLDAASKNPLTIWRNAARLARIVREEGVDIIHARSRAPAWSGYLAARRTGAAFITTYHGSYNEGFPGKRLYNSVMAKGQPVIAVSNFIRDLIVERHGIPPEQIVVIPRGADISVFSEEMVGNERTIKLIQSWGLLDDARPVIMLPGRLTRWKGQESAIDAAAILKERRGAADFLLLIVGDDTSGGGFAHYLDELISKMDLNDCVVRVDGTSDIAAAYKQASVVLSASIEPEAFGRVAVEAQAMGRPMIATDHGGARETVVHGESGWLYPPGDAEALANAMGEALDMDASERAHRGMAARARIHTSFTVAAMQRATLRVYEEAAGRPFVREI
ncbi:glycosyltransferase family 4 protein [Rhodobacteraceae bacterium NNCM2]|nr:glycosyltransferase family 4 protein [Coraliihabitans acroporae]